MTAQETYQARLKRVSDAISLNRPDRVPIVPAASALPFFLTEDTTYRDAMYDFPKASRAIYAFCRDFQPDAFNGPALTSSRANELGR